MAKVQAKDSPTNGAKDAFTIQQPYAVTVTIQGSCDFLFHAWNIESIEEKGRAAKNSAIKKTDDLESYVYRNDKGELSIPGEYLRMSAINAARYKQDPRSPRKSAMDLYKAGLVCLTEYASLGKTDWDYVSRKHVKVQRAGITRLRPAIMAGYRATFIMQVLIPEYIDKNSLRHTIDQAGRLVGIGDFIPTYGRFGIVNFEDCE
jgi:hypothetical protein